VTSTFLKAPSPEDREPFAHDGVDPRRLTEIEQRLKAARPRPAELNIEAIVRAALTADEPVMLPEPSVERRGTRSYGWIIAIGGSWACGAIAGALVTFILLSRGAPMEESLDGMTAVDEEMTKVVQPSEEEAPDGDAERPPRDDTPWENVPPWSPSDSLVTVMLLDPHGRGVASYGDGWPILRAGDFTRSQDAFGSSRIGHRAGTVPQGRPHTPDPGGDALEGMAPGPAPASPITQEELLQELLGKRPDSVL
jgi:hypothetical protein